MTNPTPEVRMTASILAVLSAFTLLVAYLQTMLTSALPAIAAQFGASPSQVAWVSSASLLVGAAAVLLVGKLADTFGRKRVLVLVLAIFSAGTVLNLFSWSLQSLIAFRAIQGVGLALGPLAYALIHDQNPADRAPRAIGIVTAMTGAGATLGLVVGGAVTSAYGWQANYWFVAPIAVALSWVLARYGLESPYRQKQRIDFLGAAIFAASIALLLGALGEAPELGWRSSYVLVLFAVGAALLAVFVVYERRTTAPLLSLRLPQIRSILKADVLMLLTFAGFYLGFVGVTFFVQSPPPGFALEVRESAVVMLPGALALIAFSIVAGELIRAWGVRPLMYAGLLILTGGFLSFLLYHGTPFQMALGFVMVGGGAAMVVNSAVNTVMDLAPAGELGAQNSLLEVCQEIGGALGIALVGSLLASFLDETTGFPTSEAYAITFAAGLIVGVIGLIVLSSIPRASLPGRPPRSDRRPQSNSIAP